MPDLPSSYSNSTASGSGHPGSVFVRVSNGSAQGDWDESGDLLATLTHENNTTGEEIGRLHATFDDRIE
jgi:hypothetical protein